MRKSVPSTSRIPSVKGFFPFSFGVTSYLYPADIRRNLKRVRGLADEMELILFEGKGYSNLPSKADVRRFARIAEKSGMRFNVHLPLDVDVVSADERFRKDSLETVAHIVELTRPLDPLSYTLHVLKDDTSESAHWKARVRDSLALIAPPHDMFCIETLAAPRWKGRTGVLQGICAPGTHGASPWGARGKRSRVPRAPGSGHFEDDSGDTASRAVREKPLPGGVRAAGFP